MAGPTLHQLLEKGSPLPPGQVVRIALHLSHLIGEVHRKGKTFGGIYPDQVAIDQEAQVNLFELTAPRLPEDLTLSYFCFVPPELLTPDGSVTPQSDIYSFGVIVFSLLSGHVPFSATSREDLTNQILDSRLEPIPTLPGEFNQLNWILKKCLLRIPSRRFASADEIAVELRQVAGAPGIPFARKLSVPAAPSEARKFKLPQIDWEALLQNRPLLAGGGGALLIIVLLIVFISSRSGGPEMTPVHSWQTKAIVTDPDMDVGGALSPKNDLIAFVSNRTGNFDIYLTRNGKDTPDQITQSPGSEENPRWSPDGDLILYTYREPRKPSMIFAVAPSGGIPQKLADDAIDASWSPEGKTIVYVSPASKSERNLLIRDYITGDTTTVLQNVKGLASPSFSYDGKQIVCEADIDQHHGLILVNAKSGKIKNLSKDTDDFSPAWDWKTGAIYFVSQHSIWRTDDSGDRQQITTGYNDSHPVPSYSGQPIHFQRRTLRQDIMSVDPATMIKKNESPEPGTSYFPRCISEAKSLIYFSGDAVAPSLKCFIAGASTSSNVLQSIAPDAAFSVSPDGATIYIESPEQAKKGLWRIAIAGGNMTSLGEDAVLPYEYSADRKQLLYGKVSGNEVFYLNRNVKTQQDSELFHLPKSTKIVRAYWQDSATVLYLTSDSHLYSFSEKANSSSLLFLQSCLDFALKPKSTAIAVLLGTPGNADLILYDTKTATQTALMHFTSDEFAKHLDWARDGSVLFYDRYKTNSDIYEATGR